MIGLEYFMHATLQDLTESSLLGVMLFYLN